MCGSRIFVHVLYYEQLLHQTLHCIDNNDEALLAAALTGFTWSSVDLVGRRLGWSRKRT